MRALQTDYLVVGAGASGMAFVDELIAHSDADVVMVERRHAPGGHWNDAYPFVRLHQPSAYYGVNSRVLGHDTIDEVGPNAGFYERATAAEIRDHYQRVLQEHLLASGRVRFFAMSEHVGAGPDGHRIVSRLTGDETVVRVRRKVVDATYLESSVPSTHTPTFAVEDGVRFVTPNDLVRLTDPGEGYTIIGAGKTAMDTCVWLLDNGVPAHAIRWIRPRDAWMLDRTYMQPLELLPWFIEGLSLQMGAAADARDVDDLFRRLEDTGTFIRIDPTVRPAVHRGATLSPAELESLRRIDDVVRLGRVRGVTRDVVVLDGGTVPAGDRVHVDCTAAGLSTNPARPIFEAERITIQSIQAGVVPFNAAMIGFLEASRHHDAERNRLSPPNEFTGEAAGWIPATVITQRAHLAWRAEPDIAVWLDNARLNAVRGVRDHLGDPRMQAALARLGATLEPALANLQRLTEVEAPAVT